MLMHRNNEAAESPAHLYKMLFERVRKTCADPEFMTNFDVVIDLHWFFHALEIP